MSASAPRGSAARVLIPLPDRDFDVTEVSVPWKLLRESGHEVVFATEIAGTRRASRSTWSEARTF